MNCYYSPSEFGVFLAQDDTPQDPVILKAGVGIGNDARKLSGDFGVDVRGLVDLSALANEVLDARPR